MARSPWRSSFIFDEPDCRPVAQSHDFQSHPIEDGDCCEPAPDSLPELMFGDRAGDRVLLWLEGVFVGVCAVAIVVAVVLMNW